ncbi:hypothetical protein ACSJGC_004952, partial [Escherichia coli]
RLPQMHRKSVCFVKSVRGAEPMEKRQRRDFFFGLCLFAHMFFPALSPDSVDNRIAVFEQADSARRSRTTERSESVSEEAEKRLDVHFLLTHLCGISHPAWRTFHTICTVAA